MRSEPYRHCKPNAKQSRALRIPGFLDCFVAKAPRNDGKNGLYLFALFAVLISSGLAVNASAQSTSGYQLKTQYDRPASGHNCYAYCLSRGGLHSSCAADCGMLEGGTNYGKTESPAPPQPQAPVRSQSYEYHDTDYNDADQETAPEEFNGVEFSCFKRCRIQGDSFETCQMLCQR